MWLVVADTFKYDALCCVDSDTRQQLLLPRIERLLHHPNVERPCIIKLHHAKVYNCIVDSAAALQDQQGIHRHQTPPRYRNTASSSRLKV